MQPKLKYVWDQESGRQPSTKELRVIDQFSRMIISGCGSKELKTKLKKVKFSQ